MKERLRSAVVVFSFSMFASVELGCRPGDLYPNIEYVERLHQKNTEQLQKHDENMTQQHTAQTPEKTAELEAFRRDTEKRINEIEEEAKQLKFEVKTPLENLGNVVTGIGSKLLGIDLPVREYVKENLESAKKEVRNETDTKVAAATIGVVEKTKVMVDVAKTEIAALRESLKDRTLADEFDDKELTSLKEVVEQRRQEFEAALNDPAKLRSTVLNVARDAGLRPEAIAALEKAKDDDLYNLILTLLGGGALGGVASRLGPSRNAKELDEIKAELRIGRKVIAANSA